MTRCLSERFDARAVIGVYSRLVVDLNRFPDDPTFIPAISDGIGIPANRNVSPVEKAWRTESFFAPYHDRVDEHIDDIQAAGLTPHLVLVHSMTDVMNGVARPEQIDIMFDRDESLARPLLSVLRPLGSFDVGENSPYGLDETDYTAVVHGVRRGLPHVQFEIRQDLLLTESGMRELTDIMGDAIEAAIGPLLMQ